MLKISILRRAVRSKNEQQTIKKGRQLAGEREDYKYGVIDSFCGLFYFIKNISHNGSGGKDY